MIPKLTKGALLIDQLVQATFKSAQHPKNSRLLRAMAEKRGKIEQYMKRTETKAKMDKAVRIHAGGRPNTKGWSVSKTRHGKWRLVLTSIEDGSPKRVGLYARRADAEETGREMVRELRKETAA